NGKENNRLHQAAGTGRGRQSVAADRSGFGPARPQHHGVLQELQRADPEDGKGNADSRHHYNISGPLLHLRDEDATGVLFHQEGGQAGKRLQDPRARQSRRHYFGASARNRSTKNEGPELRHDRSGDADGGRVRPVDGHRGGGGTIMTQHGKKLIKQREGIDRTKLYPIDEAIKMIKDRAKAKFDETVEVAMNLGVDPRHADQMVRGVVLLPNGTGRSVRVAVFARGVKADEAKAAGADVVGAEDLVEKVQGGNIDFDRCIATPDLMPLVGRLGKVLGPRGMMPNPKVGTVTMDVTNAVKGAKGGSVEFRVEKAGIVQAGVGKASFPADHLVQNIKAFADAVQKARPAGAKGTFISRVAISSTMGPGVKVEPASLFGQS